MRVMVIVKANNDFEAGVRPTAAQMEEMGAYNEELVRAGVMLAGEGLVSSKEGARIKFLGDKRTVVDGPFPETKELVGGFWIWQVKDMDEAIEWAKRCPNPRPGESQLEIRRVAEFEDFDEMTPELKAQEDAMRLAIEKQQS